MPPSLHASQDLGTKDSAGRVEPGLCSLFQLQQPLLLLCLCDVRRWLLCTARAAHWEKGEMPPHHTSLPPSWQQQKQTCCLSLSPAGFAGLSLRLSLWPSGTYLTLLFFPFMLFPYLFGLSWAPPAQVLPWLVWDFCFLCVGSSDSEDKEGGIQTQL